MDAMRTALSAFGQRMTQSNRKFWTGKVRALEQDTSLTDRQRLNLLAPYIHEGSWPTEGSVATPAELLLHPGDDQYPYNFIDDDGIAPPAPVEKRERYLAALRVMLNEVWAGSGYQSDGPEELEVPEDFCHFMALTDGISDFDYLRIGAVGLYGMFLSVLPQRRSMYDFLPCHRSLSDEGWTVGSGWRTALGNMASTEMLWCCKETGTSDEQNWSWRVWCEDLEAPDGRLFASIADFLEFKGDWFERLPAGWEDLRLGPPEDSDEWIAQSEDEEAGEGEDDEEDEEDDD